MRTYLVLALLLLAGTAACVPRGSGAAPEAEASRLQTYVYTIPAGTAAAQARGEDIALLPTRIDLRVGDTLVIENHDITFHNLGWFVIAPGQRYERVFSEPGTLVLFEFGCTGAGRGRTYTIVAHPQ